MKLSVYVCLLYDWIVIWCVVFGCVSDACRIFCMFVLFSLTTCLQYNDIILWRFGEPWRLWLIWDYLSLSYFFFHSELRISISFLRNILFKTCFFFSILKKKSVFYVNSRIKLWFYNNVFSFQNCDFISNKKYWIKSWIFQVTRIS